MAQSYQTTTISVDSTAVGRLMALARETDVYESQAEARADNWEALLTLLCDRFEATPGPLRADVGTKYDTDTGGDA